MWNKKKDEEYPAKTGSPLPAAAGSQAMSTAPAPSHHAQDGRGTAMIGKSVMIKGQIFSREDLTIDGEVEGSVELQEHRLTVGPNGKVQAGVKAREIVVLGTIQGNVEASEKIDIRKDARLVGDIKTARIVIEDGAYFKGSIDITKPEVRQQPAPSRPVATQATAAAPVPAPAAATSGSLDLKRQA